MDAVRASYDAVARRYAMEVSDELPDKYVDRALYAAFAELAAAACARGLPVADVGCGPGHVTAHLAALGLPVRGIDLSPGMVDVARRDNPGLAFEVGDLTALPVPAGAWAGAVVSYSIIHLDAAGRRAAFAELARAVVPLGWVLICFHVSRHDQEVGSHLRLERWWDHDVDLTINFLDPSQVADELDGAGFTVMARTERAPWPLVEAPTRRALLLAQRRGEAAG